MSAVLNATLMLAGLEPGSDPARTGVAAAVRSAIGAETLLLLSRNGGAGVDIELLDGPLPPPGILATLPDIGLGGTGPLAVSFDRGVALVQGCADGRDDRTRLLAAFFAVEDGRELEIESELLSMLLKGLLRCWERPSERSRLTAPVELRIPDGMVVGKSAAMKGLLSHISRTIGSGLDVLLTGETGVGKELFARLIHLSGGAAAGPFVAINCAAIPSSLLEAELFGISARVATGVDPRPGRIVQAEGGTIFLDEIGELSKALQAKLLRFLQEREVLPLGAPAPRPVKVRVVAATNRPLGPYIADGCFRADLYYRLRSLQFHIPPLRERPEDIPDLAAAMLTRASSEYARNVRGLTKRALQTLQSHDWPGNVRELESELRRAVLLCHAKESIRDDHLRDVGANGAAGGLRPVGATGFARPTTPSGGDSPRACSPLDLASRIEEVERLALLEALARAAGNRSEAARLLGITRNGLRMKMSRLGLPA